MYSDVLLHLRCTASIYHMREGCGVEACSAAIGCISGLVLRQTSGARFAVPHAVRARRDLTMRVLYA